MKHIEVVAAVIICRDEILCMQKGSHKYDYLSFKYEFPGGKVESGESREIALVRELEEEMNLKVDIQAKDFFITVNHPYADFEITMHAFVCRVFNKEFERKEHSDHKWLIKNDLLSVDWAMADMPIVEKIMSGGLIQWM